MLIWMRESSGAGILKFFLMGLLVMAVSGLVLMDVGGFFTGNMGSGTIAKGGGVNIGSSEFNRTVDRVVSRQGIGARDAYQLGLVDNILKSEIQNQLFTKKSHDLGLVIDDAVVMQQVSKIAEPLATDGRTKKEALQQILFSQGIREAEFISGLREELANGLVRSALQTPATLPSPAMAETLYRYDNEKRSADIILFKYADVTDASNPTDEQLEKFYESNKQTYLIPESRTITMATLQGDMLRKNVKISDEQLQAEYQKNIASYTKPERRVVEQIVVNSEEEAQKALDDMKAGKAVKNSMTQEYEQAGLLAEIGGATFAAEKDAVVGPIKSDLGYHVLKVKDILAEEVTPLANVRDTLKTQLENVALSEEMYNAGNTIEDRIASGDDFNAVTKEYGMTTEKIGPFRRNGNNAANEDLFKPYGTDRENFIQAAYDYDEGEVPPVIETADGQFHLIHIDSVTPDSYTPYETVKAELKKRWVQEQQSLATKEKARSVIAALEEGKSLADIAKEHGASVQKVANLNRKDKPAAPMTAIGTAQAFSTEVGKGFSTESDDGVLVGVVTDMTLPSSDNAPKEELQALNDLTAASMAQDVQSQYINGLMRGKAIKINKAVLDQMYGDQPAQ